MNINKTKTMAYINAKIIYMKQLKSNDLLLKSDMYKFLGILELAKEQGIISHLDKKEFLAEINDLLEI